MLLFLFYYQNDYNTSNGTNSDYSGDNRPERNDRGKNFCGKYFAADSAKCLRSSSCKQPSFLYYFILRVMSGCRDYFRINFRTASGAEICSFAIFCTGGFLQHRFCGFQFMPQWLDGFCIGVTTDRACINSFSAFGTCVML